MKKYSVMYEPVFTKEFQACVKRHAGILKLIKNKNEIIFLQVRPHSTAYR